MGLLDWLIGAKSTPLPEVQVWLTSSARYEGIIAEAQSVRTRSEHVLMVAHFRESLESLVNAMQQAGEEYHLWRPSSDPQPWENQTSPAVMVTLFEFLEQLSLPGTSAFPLTVIAAEVHPLESVDRRLAESCSRLGTPTTIRAHASLDDPLIASVCGERVMTLLKSLGMAEGEAILSPMVSRSIRTAQHRFSRTCRSNHLADSAAVWFELNRPPS